MGKLGAQLQGASTIFFDLDGVLAKHGPPIAQLFDVEWPPGKPSWGSSELFFKGKDEQLTPAHIFPELRRQPPEFWAEFQPDEQALELAQMYAHKTWVLSTALCTNAVIGKHRWVQRHLGGCCGFLPMYEWGNTGVTPTKCRLAKPGRLLVDDTRSQVTEFIKHGGDAHLWEGLENVSSI